MQISRKTATTSLIGAQVTVLLVGYMLRSPDLSATAQRQDSLRQHAKQEAFDRQEAMQRAQTCLPLMTELPITDGTAAYFSSVKNGRIVIHKNRPMPSGTVVCDAFGNTGIVTGDFEGNPVVTDIRRMPFEEIETILQERGVMPRQFPRQPNQSIQ